MLAISKNVSSFH